ncbi:MAG: (E)-4-hydroxy-3-methylbut-2-enyl-diphosphate synthase [Prevotellaceae bacterium]|jgi:(E)-4-hydroxy-3-methylbut-2-enyl-diphosphate synthase|nr:(E)-4-hydroxy-3-methylbut-2-enyl-diphosphate synthase [Prevotellaceae bacterium]
MYKSSEITIGSLTLGGGSPVRVQTMANTDTNDIEASVSQAISAIEAGAELVRFTTQGMREGQSLVEIHKTLRSRGYSAPLVADVHFTPSVADFVAQHVEKVRINPGNYIKSIKKRGDSLDYSNAEFEEEHEILRQRFVQFLNICKQHDTAIRIGVNHGSLSERMMNRYGDTPLGMVESAMELMEMCRAENFEKAVVSLKASNTVLMIKAVRLLAQTMDERGFHFPIHLGVTEAGDGEDGRIKSAIGIGALLADGIGDTIRVSLSEPPEMEIPVAYAILQAARCRITKTEYISCPSCGRTLFDLQTVVAKIKAKTAHLTGLKIGIMGCIVNGPGEMADADYGYVGAGRGRISLYKGQNCVKKNVPEAEAVDALVDLIKEHGHWHEIPR